MSKIEFKIEGIGKFIKDNRFFVPIYQRPFSWEADKHIGALINDIKNNLGESEYFLGTLVLTKTDGKLEIVDGQQRLTTILLLFAALRDIFKKIGKNKKIQEEYLSEYDRRNEEEIPKLELSQQDNDFYKNYIVNKDQTYSPKKTSHTYIKEGYEKAIKEFCNNDESILLDWMDFIDDKLKVVVIIVPEESNAFTIFETLNDRGLILAQVDLLKNYLYSKCNKTHLKTVQNNWNELVLKLEALEETSILDYIKVYWMANSGFIREKNNELFVAIKNQYKNSIDINTFVSNLLNDVEIYLALINVNSVFWNDYNSQCKEIIASLKFLELSQFRSLAFSILKNFDETETNKSLKLILSWMVRNMVCGATGGGALEQSYSKKAIEIQNKKIKKSIELRDSLKELIPSGEDFKQSFKTATVNKEKLARFYLREIENFNRGGKNPELLVNSNPDSVNLEHILPKKPEMNYPKFSEEVYEQYLKRLGNLTIMNTKLNNKQKNVKFENKKKEYQKSDIEITKSLSTYDGDWCPEYIEQRQSELAEIALKVWSIKFD